MDTTPDTINVNGVTYTRPTGETTTRIVVLQRGWIVAGTYAEDGDEITVSGAKVIRRWGTTKGLGELTSGPLADTIVDPAGTVRAHRLAVVMTIDCEPGAW